MSNFPSSPEGKTLKRYWDWMSHMLEYEVLHSDEDYKLKRGRFEGFNIARKLIQQIAEFNGKQKPTLLDAEERFFENMRQMNKEVKGY